MSEDQCEVIGRRVCDKLAAADTGHLVQRRDYPAIKILAPGGKASGRTVFTPPAREGACKNSCVDVSFIADLLGRKVRLASAACRQHQRPARPIKRKPERRTLAAYGLTSEATLRRTSSRLLPELAAILSSMAWSVSGVKRLS